MKDAYLTARDRRILEQVAAGADSAGIAAALDLTPGTVRVYLHFLYRKLGVRNRTEAALWFLDASGREAPAAPVPGPAPRALHGTFGDAALATNLLAALGVMESFLGPFSRVWEAGAFARGAAPPPGPQVAASRRLWQALLRGDFAYAKRLHDEPEAAERDLLGQPDEAALVASMLWLGGYTEAGRRAARALDRRTKAMQTTRNQQALVAACREVAHGRPGQAALQRVATATSGSGAVRALAMVLLFHAHRLRRDAPAARHAADALWAAAEAARGDLEAMGFRPLDRHASLAAAPKTDPAPARRAAAKRGKRAAAAA